MFFFFETNIILMLLPNIYLFTDFHNLKEKLVIPPFPSSVLGQFVKPLYVHGTN